MVISSDPVLTAIKFLQAKIPKTIAKIAFKFIEKSVEKKAKFDIG